MIFSHKTFYPLGLDISEKSFKLVQLKRRGGVLGIQALGWVDLPAGTIVNGDIKNVAEDGNDGSDIENEANAVAGIIMRKYGKLHPEIYL